MQDVPQERSDAEALPSGNVTSPVRFAGLVFDLSACTLVRESGEAIPLTRGEFRLLRLFVGRPGRVLSRDAILEAVANRPLELFDRSVDALVGRLRRKIEPDPKTPRPGRHRVRRGLSVRRTGLAGAAARRPRRWRGRDLVARSLPNPPPSSMASSAPAKGKPAQSALANWARPLAAASLSSPASSQPAGTASFAQPRPAWPMPMSRRSPFCRSTI